MAHQADTQNTFLQQLIAENQVVEIYLRGRKQPLKGLIVSFDIFTLVIANEEKSRLVLKHAIDYIEPANFSVKRFVDRLQAKPKNEAGTGD